MTKSPGRRQPTILCLASYRKGDAFLVAAKQQGWKVLLLTSKSLEHADWPREYLDDVYYIPDVANHWHMPDMIEGVSFLARSIRIDRIVALDDFDVEKAAALREHLRVPGMGDTTARYFRDKLAMRTRAKEVGIAIPEFVPVVNYEEVRAFLQSVPGPYVLKPRMMAAAIGIKRVPTGDDLWPLLDALGDEQSDYLLERFVAGDVFHVDSLVADYKVHFAVASQYGTPPLETSHDGRVFTTKTLKRRSADERTLLKLNQTLLKSLGMRLGTSHSEFIKSRADGAFYFLETSARVGGAHIVDLIEAASGLNLWAEWARLECRTEGEDYRVDPPRKDYAGLLVSLARQERPDLSGYDDAEVVWRLDKKHHAGLVVRSPNHARVEALLESYTERFYQDFFAKIPPRLTAAE
ncbi:MAG: acetyl-CoA carboxylase biotin carboxylase subunit family protein [Gemmatimonadales bacterium]